MSEPNRDEAREFLTGGGEDVVEPWGERAATVEGGLDDTTAPGLDDTEGDQAEKRERPDEDLNDGTGVAEPPD